MLPVKESKVLLGFGVNKGRLKSTTAMGKDRPTGKRYVRVQAHGRGDMVCPSWWSRVLRVVAFTALLGMGGIAQGAWAEAASKTQQEQQEQQLNTEMHGLTFPLRLATTNPALYTAALNEYVAAAHEDYLQQQQQQQAASMEQESLDAVLQIAEKHHGYWNGFDAQDPQHYAYAASDPDATENTGAAGAPVAGNKAISAVEHIAKAREQQAAQERAKQQREDLFSLAQKLYQRGLIDEELDLVKVHSADRDEEAARNGFSFAEQESDVVYFAQLYLARVVAVRGRGTLIVGTNDQTDANTGRGFVRGRKI